MEVNKPIQIQNEWTISEQELKSISPLFNSIIVGRTSVKQFPDLQYGLNLFVVSESDETGERKNIVKMALKLTSQKENIDTIRVKSCYSVKSADFLTLYDVEYADSDEYCHTLCLLTDLFDAEKKFIVDGKLTIEMKGMIFVESEKTEKSEETLGSFLWERDDKDFTINVGKENEVKTGIEVHKCVLASRSPVFDRMIQTNMKEKKEGKVKIIDFDAKVVQAAVEYCYDQDIHEITTNIDDATSLLQFSDKYDIKDLKDKLENHLTKDLRPDNICKITNAAIITNSPKLLDFCFNSFLIFMRQAIPVNDIALLDKDFAKELLEKAFSPEYC